jgi:uncharacterized membrane protein YsdA (DUF1294 family)/cold shock CspA family protein
VRNYGWQMGERQSGTLTKWNDDRGYGFITVNDHSKPIFVHISEFEPSGSRPSVGAGVQFDIVTDALGRTKAVTVHRKGRVARVVTPAGSSGYVILAAFVALFVAVDIRWPLPPWVYVVYLGMSVIAYTLYALDKRAAMQGGWRTPEATLLLAGFLGGWPGAVVAQLTLRHKTRKRAFRLAFWSTVFFNVLVFVLLATQAVAGMVLRS